MIMVDDVRTLLTELQEPVLTLYLNIDAAASENQATTPAWRIWLKNTLRDLETGDWASQNGDLWAAIRERVEVYVSNADPKARSLVLFATADNLRDFVLPLPVENRADFGPALVAPLLWLLDEYEQYLVVLVDQEKASFFTAYLGQMGYQGQVEIDIDDYDWGQKTINPATSHGRNLDQGSHRDAFEAMLDEHRARFYREVATRIAELAEDQKTQRIVLGGIEESAHTVKGFISEAHANHVVGILPIPMRSSTSEIFERVLPTALEHEREAENELVEQVIDMAKSGGRGALGRKAVLDALDQRRVQTLILPYPVEDDSMERELPLQVLESSGEIELVHGEAAERLKAEGGIAARLYYAL